ncbi:uncharacterized protein BDCG_01632 [Blastomyces dermatitidis ER-3]|uniref:Uncharacterized protein n=1 Tax=Ajellomyces dermatitidis (strain ER-3 / ATCC MYA-2586) TaxID=559297 RepID=A0ABP2ESF6_AJEDR|nr:uncharacterized protein BDCG_01632 [Blastomyces dermatitidis ER-3]EEQ86512.2 hypothetical protein BDCG_01632 [Blastomyces dermatitidis ER-3]EQL37218.1 hypothetical protein BDFG_01479 [Blastomyces dermatitidis ATCC 26199]
MTSPARKLACKCPSFRRPRSSPLDKIQLAEEGMWLLIEGKSCRPRFCQFKSPSAAKDTMQLWPSHEELEKPCCTCRNVKTTADSIIVRSLEANPSIIRCLPICKWQTSPGYMMLLPPDFAAARHQESCCSLSAAGACGSGHPGKDLRRMG